MNPIMIFYDFFSRVSKLSPIIIICILAGGFLSGYITKKRKDKKKKHKSHDR